MERSASWRRFWLRSAILFAHSLRTSISLMQKVYLYFIYIYKGYLDNVNRFQSRKQLVVADDLVNFSFKNSAPNVVERRTWLNAERRGTLNAVKTFHLERTVKIASCRISFRLQRAFRASARWSTRSTDEVNDSQFLPSFLSHGRRIDEIKFDFYSFFRHKRSNVLTRIL